MRSRLSGFLVFLLGCLLSLSATSAASPAAPPQAVAPSGTAGPQPTAAVQKKLDEASRLAAAKQPLDALKAADQALETARQVNDVAGAALAQQARAKALADLQRADEALAAWQEAAQTWERLGDAPGQITAFAQAGLVCVSNNKKDDAAKFFAEGLAIGKSETHHLAATAQALHDSGVALFDGPLYLGFAKPIDKPQKLMAQEFQTAALAIREKQAPESMPVVESLTALAKVALGLGLININEKEYLLAKASAARAAEMGQRLAPDSSIVVESLRTLAYTEHMLGDPFENMRGHLLEAWRIQKKLAPGGSLVEVDILKELGNAEEEETHYPAAREYLEQAVAMAERLGPESPELVKSLNSLGVLEESEGNLSAALDHTQRALALGVKLHANVGPYIMNLGIVAKDQYDFALARDYYEKALAIFQETSPDAMGVPYALAGLAETFNLQGDYQSALEYNQRALTKMEQKKANPDQELSRMGDILRAQGKFSAADEYYHKALAIREQETPDSNAVADSLNKLARLAQAQGKLSSATEYDRRALEAGQKSCPDFVCVVDIINDLGELAYEQGNLAGAESYLRRAADIREKNLGPLHPDLARSLNSLAITVAALGKTEEALAGAFRAENIGREHLRMSVQSLSERQALAYEGMRASGLDLALTLAADRASTPAVRSQVLDAVIRSRALVFDELAARHRSAYGSGNPEVKQLASQLSSARARLATLVFRGVGDATPEVYRTLLDDARANKEKAERGLAEKSLAFRQDQARAQLGLTEVAGSLPPGSALVAYVRYARQDLPKPGAGKEVPAPVSSYAAFVLPAGKNEPEFVTLGSASDIESLLTAWRRDIAQQAEVESVTAPATENRRFGAALRRRIWDPVVPKLGGAKQVLVVPDAALHLVSLAALPVGNSAYLLETGPVIHYLSTERDLVPAPSRRGEGILVVGNPAFDQARGLSIASSKPSAAEGATTSNAGALLRGTRSACGTFQTLHFSPLPASQQEAEAIAAVWKQSGTGTLRGAELHSGSGELLQFIGADASPEAFEQYAPGKRVLHVATHGFFLEGSCQSAAQRRLDASKTDENILPAAAENPLLLSGLAFAGANRRASAKPDETDGILTAEEIAGINLEGVDWAVLSACDTGVGEIKVGEGVFGLRRAFQVAGAKTVIMSLWPIEDQTTRRWMEALYREHFLGGKNTAVSIRAASLQILNQRRVKHQSTHPFFWGAFIAAGDWQ